MDKQEENKKNMVNWQEYGNPFLDFTEEITQEWIDKGFSREECKERLNIGLKAKDSDYAWWVKNIKRKNAEWVLNCGNDKELKEEYAEYLENQIENSDSKSKEELVITVSEKPKKKRLKLSTTLLRRIENLENSLRKENYISAQRWLNENYPERQRWLIKNLNLSNQNLSDSLDLTEFTGLEVLDCHNNQLTSLDLSGLINLRILSCFNNKKMVNLILDNCSNITILEVSNNNRLGGNLSIFSHLVNLEKMSLVATNFYGSLEPLKWCLKLKGLFIGGTNIDSGLEYLPSGVRVVDCDSVISPNNLHPQVTKIEKQLCPYTNNVQQYKHDFLEKEKTWKSWKKDNQKLIEQAKGTPAQRWLDKNYPREQRANIKKLDVREQNIGDDLDLSNFTNLEELHCGENKLIYLDISKCNNLRRLHCSDNQLMELKLSQCNKLENLHCSKNQLTSFQLPNEKSGLKQLIIHENKLEQDLFFLKEFTNLEEIYLGGNLFYGSLESLKNLNKLRSLDISDNNVSYGLEYLPNSIEEFHCYVITNPQAKVKKIQEELQLFVIDERKGKYNWEVWRKEKKAEAQQWLNKKYSNKEQTETIDLADLKVDHDNELIIENYPNLKEIKNKEIYNVNKWSNKIIKITISNCPQLKTVIAGGFKDNQELTLSNLPNLTHLNCSNNQLIALNTLNCPQLERIWCSYNQLTNLDLTNFSNLKEVECNNNFLTKIKLPVWGDKLEELYLDNNNFPNQNLAFLSHLMNLKELSLENNGRWTGTYNRFIGSLDHLKNMTNLRQLNISNTNISGSLEPLQKMSKLEELRVDNTDIDSGLEYLSNSIKIFRCSSDKSLQAKIGKLDEELFLYGRNLKAWQEAHPELMIKARGGRVDNLYDNDKTSVIGSIPEQVEEKEHNKTEENYNLEEINYQEIILRDKRPFSWETNQNKSLSPKDLPIKLYNIKTGKVEWTKNNPNIKSYVILSYVWGSRKDKKIAEKIKIAYQKDNEEYEQELTMTKWGKKALVKAKKVCQLLNIDYLWMDQLCIDQTNVEEQNQEVPKMGKYYGNAEVTLISINTKNKNTKDEDENTVKENRLARKTLKKVINSQWFTRSWTFQEGWLSKQTLFMFDDCLVDGRILAQIWAALEQEDHLIIKDYQISNEDPKQFITPLGWTYGKKKDNWRDQVNLGLSQALIVIKDRGHGNPIDGIYSILGLLPYGEKVKPKYKEQGNEYTKEELEGVLLEVMKEAVKNSYAEPLAWFGSRRNEPYLWWIPEIDEKGSISFWGKAENVKFEPEIIEFTENGIKLVGRQRVVNYLDTEGIDSCYSEDEDPKYLNDDTIRIFTTDNDSFSLQGDWETLEKIKPGDILVIPNEEQLEIKNDDFNHLGIIVPRENKITRPINVMKLWRETAQESIEKSLFIDMVNKKVIEGEENIAQYEAQIQVDPYQK